MTEGHKVLMADIADFTTYRSKWSLKPHSINYPSQKASLQHFCIGNGKAVMQLTEKKSVVILSFLPCFSKGINVLKPTFWTIANICPRLSPFFSRLLQYLFFGFRKRDNTSKKTWKSPLLDCLSALRKFPFPHLFCWLFSCQNKWRRWWWRW